MFRFFALIFLSLFIKNLAAQEITKSCYTSVRFNNVDVFQEIGFKRFNAKKEHEIGFAVGINKTYFQKRPFPSLHYAFLFQHLNYKYLSILSGFSVYSTFLNTNRFEREIHFYNELLYGVKLGLGKRFKFYVYPEFGFLVESFHSDFFSKTIHASKLNYSLKAGFEYAF